MLTGHFAGGTLVTHGHSPMLQISPYFAWPLAKLAGKLNMVEYKDPYPYRVLTIHSLPTDSSCPAVLALCQSSKPKFVHNFTLNLFGTIYLALLRCPQSSGEKLPPSCVPFLSS